MPYNVGPTVERPTHDMLLTDSTGGRVGLIFCDVNGTPDPFQWTYSALPPYGIKTYTGTQAYSDTPPPWTPKVQSDWSGGRGSKDFDKDTTKYFDSYRINTTRAGEIICGPWDYWATGNFTSTGATTNHWVGYWEGTMNSTWSRSAMTLGASKLNTKVADSYVATGNAAFVWAIVDAVGSPAALTIRISADSVTPGEPGTSIASTTLAYTSITSRGMQVIRVALAATQSAGSTYWVSFEHTGGDADNYWGIGYAPDTGQGFKSYQAAWGAETGALFHRVCLAEKPFRAHFAKYKGNVFTALEYDDGSPSRLFINGWQGAATSGNTTALADTAVTWANDQWNNGIVVFNEGIGSGQPNNWALITTTTASPDAITFATMDVAPGAPAGNQTLYSIIGTPRWTEIDTTAASPNWDASTSGVVTDVLSVNHGMLFAKGDANHMWRYRAYNASGTWTTEWVDESATAAAMFTYLMDAADQEHDYIWAAKGGYPAQLYYAQANDWSGTGAYATQLSFTRHSAVNVGDVGERITGLVKYGEYGNLHALKEGSIYQIVDKIPFQLGLAQYANSRDRRNGAASTTHNVYLYFSFHNTVMRYFNGQLDNIGPTRDDEGLPSNRLGPVADLMGYENLVIAAFDGGENNYSCIMAFNGLGWCELYRPPAVGLRIRDLFIEVMPGDNVDRLWFSCGSEIGWLPIASDPYNFPINNNYHYYAFGFDGGYLITSYYYFNQKDTNKLFNNMRIIAERNNGTSYYVLVDYRLDDSTTWTALTTLDSFQDSVNISSTYNTTGRRIQLRITPYTSYPAYSTRITAIVLEALIQQTFKYYMEVIFRIADKDIDLQEAPDDRTTALSKYNQLLTWSESPAGILANTRIGITDSKYVKIDPLSLKVINKVTRENRTYHVAKCRMYQLN